MKKLLLLLLLTPFVGLSQSLTGYDFSCKTMEILDPVKYSDEYYPSHSLPKNQETGLLCLSLL